MKQVSLKGVVIGSVTDIVATNLLMLPLAVYATVKYGLTQVPPERAGDALIQAVRSDSLLNAIQVILGSLCSILGGYVAAWIAKKREMLNGGLAAFLCVASGVYGLFFGTAVIPIWEHLIGFVASPALSTLGGYIRLKTSKPRPST